MCIPRVFRVGALRPWCVQLELVGGILEEGWLVGLFLAGFLEACGWGGFGVSVGVGIGGFGLISLFWGMGVVFEVV